MSPELHVQMMVKIPSELYNLIKSVNDKKYPSISAIIVTALEKEILRPNSNSKTILEKELLQLNAELRSYKNS